MYTVVRKLSRKSGNGRFTQIGFMLLRPMSEPTRIGSITPCCIISQASIVDTLSAPAGYDFHSSLIWFDPFLASGSPAHGASIYCEVR